MLPLNGYSVLHRVRNSLISCRRTLHVRNGSAGSTKSLSSRNFDSLALAIPTDGYPTFLPPHGIKQIPNSTTDDRTSTFPLLRSLVGLNGAQIVRDTLIKHGVERVFGYPGAANVHILDCLHNQSNLKMFLPRHEQGAGHMAEGYARIAKKPGVVLVTSGPGATNIITPLQDAMSDGIPLVVLSGQVSIHAFGTGAFQEADIVSMARACTKWAVTVTSVADLAPALDEAFRVATSGRPGPVLIDIPKDVSVGILQENGIKPSGPSYAPFHPPAPPTSLHFDIAACIQKAASLINNAEMPLIIAGAGVLASSAGASLLAELSQRGNIPVATTLHGLGAFDEDNPLSMHMLGVHGSVYGNYAVQRADALVVLGARLDDHVTADIASFAPAARAAGRYGRGGIIRFEIEPSNINKGVEADVPVLGDVADNLAALIPLVEYRRRSLWADHITVWKAKYPFIYEKGGKGEPMKPQSVIEELDKQIADLDDVVITTGVGHHQMWTAQHVTWRPGRTLVTSGGLGTMGFGLPAAIGAKMAPPSRTVIDIDGDASFTMTAMELVTAAEYGIGVKVLILNNNVQGMVYRWQSLLFDSRTALTRMVNPDFLKLADAAGIRAIRCHTSEELPSKMKEFLEYDGNRPIVLECIVDEYEELWPIIHAGKGLHQLEMHPALPINSVQN